MTKQQKVISLSLAQKISEVAKAKHIELAESEWWWWKYWKFPKVENPNREWIDKEWKAVGFELENTKNYRYKKDKTGHWRLIAPAYDCSELGEIIPEKYLGYEGYFRRDDKKWGYNWGRIEGGIYIEENNEAEARGLLYYYLMENNLLK